jgi:hypothetical protein
MSTSRASPGVVGRSGMLQRPRGALGVEPQSHFAPSRRQPKRLRYRAVCVAEAARPKLAVITGANTGAAFIHSHIHRLLPSMRRHPSGPRTRLEGSMTCSPEPGHPTLCRGGRGTVCMLLAHGHGHMARSCNRSHTRPLTLSNVSTTGLGRASAEALLQKGYKVVMACRRSVCENQSDIEVAAAACRGGGGTGILARTAPGSCGQ